MINHTLIKNIQSRTYANQITYTTFKGGKVTSKSERLYLITELGSDYRFVDEIPKEFYAVTKTEFKNIINPTLVYIQCTTEVKQFCPTCGIVIR